MSHEDKNKVATQTKYKSKWEVRAQNQKHTKRETWGTTDQDGETRSETDRRSDQEHGGRH